jgi:DNA-binding transcriptional MerR regulator
MRAMTHPETLSITEVRKLTGLTARALRHDETQGLVTPERG